MDIEEFARKPVKAAALGEDLSTLSVSELEGRIAALETEIARVKSEIASKRAHEAAASALFKR